jgi:hypothetical protein
MITTLDFLCNLRMGPIFSGKACQGQILQRIVPIHKLQVLNMTPGIALTNPYFLGNFKMGPISWSVALHHLRKTFLGKTLQLIGPYISFEENEES